jgi:uncharacterized protein (TIGR02466 family)
MTDITPPKNPTQARWHFGVPIYEKKLPNFSVRSAAVVQQLYRLKDADKGVVRSNQGGWHSSDDLHLTEHPDCKWLIYRILQVSTNVIKNFEDGREFRDIRLVSAWANINYRGNWNAPHEHLPCTWSGVFYVDAGEQPEESPAGVLDGQILFFDPMPLGREWKRPPAISYKPVTGTMLIFPSFLTHMVAPYFGEKPRISIAFNLLVDR